MSAYNDLKNVLRFGFKNVSVPERRLLLYVTLVSTRRERCPESRGQTNRKGKVEMTFVCMFVCMFACMFACLYRSFSVSHQSSGLYQNSHISDAFCHVNISLLDARDDWISYFGIILVGVRDRRGSGHNLYARVSFSVKAVQLAEGV